MVYRKLHVVARQAQAAVSEETANNQPSSDVEQPEPILVCSPCFLPAAAEVPVTIVTNKDHNRKRQVSESEADEIPISTATDKSGKRGKQNSEIQDSPDHVELMMNYFDKRFEGIEKKLQQPSNKNTKTEDTFKFKHKGNRMKFKFNQQILQIVVENLSSALNNDNTSEANDLCDDLISKLKRRNKLIKFADRSVLGWDTVAEYEADAIARGSGDEKKIRQADNRALTKRKTKTSNKLFLRLPSQKPSGQQFWVLGEHNSFTPLSQRNFNLRFPSNNFTHDGYYGRAQWRSSSNVRSGDACFGCGERGHWRKYCPNLRPRN